MLRRDVLYFNQNLCQNLEELHNVLTLGRYQHGTYQQFTVNDPKQRVIHKATVRDRVVHQAVVSALEPTFDKTFIYDSYSCRIGKGAHSGIRRLRYFLNKESANDSRKVYVLKCDIRKYFASIDHEILLRLISRRINDDDALELIRLILLSHNAETGKGIPLGNVTSQLFANIYLHELDWHIKQALQIKYYVRYCDDFVIVSCNKAYLVSLIDNIRRFLKNELQLDLHPNKISIRSWYQGIDFLGYVLRPNSTTLRTKTRRRMLAKVNQSNIASYLGLCAHANAFCLSQLACVIAWGTGYLHSKNGT
jgi:RNA-directed DNA polymerase